MKLKSKLVVAVVVLVLSTATYLILAKFSADDISAENYMNKLTQIKDKSIFQYSTTQYIYNDFFIRDASNYVSSQNPSKRLGQYELNYYNFNSTPMVEVTDEANGVGYTVNYLNEIPYGYSVYQYPLGQMNRPSKVLKDYLGVIMQKNDLTIKTSNDRSFDILILETKECFIIYTVQGHLANPFSIWVQQFHKKKYFHVLP
jgi:hypothetical protein